MDTPDTRLVALHAENGSPHARLSSALAALEGADWGLMLHGEAGLARQLAALLGPGTLRIDPRLKLSREVFAAHGLALATIDADWRGAKAVWLLEPTERDFKRATRSSVPLIADSTLAPGGGWLGQGAQYLVYRDGATLSGFGDLEISALFGKGKAPVRAAAAPSDLSLAMVLRDLATLPLRLARAARTAAQLAEQLGGAAQPVGPTALLLAPDSAADTLAPLGGVLAAAVAVSAGTLLSPGVQSGSAALALLRQDITDSLPEGSAAAERERQGNRPRQEEARQDYPRPERRNEGNRSERPESRERQDNRPPRPQERWDNRPPAKSEPVKSEPVKSELAKPEAQHNEAQPEPRRSDKPQNGPKPLNYTPEIVFSDSLTQHAPTAGSAELTQITPVSSGPDEPDVVPPLEDAAEHIHEQLSEQPQAAPEAVQAEPIQAEHIQTQAPQQEPEINLPPDLPPTPESGAANEMMSGLDERGQQLYARLRDWRNAEAKRLEISRFIVASNATLAEIARQSPRNEEELRKVRGMGPERIRKYGAAILAALQG